MITNTKAYFKKKFILETGIADFHKLTVVSLKSQMLKAPPKSKLCRDHNKAFDENSFNDDINSTLDSIKILDYSSFEDILINVITTHAPIKNKNIRANNHKFMTKALQKATMTRSGLKYVYLKS